jgi:hypothetical protein
LVLNLIISLRCGNNEFLWNMTLHVDTIGFWRWCITHRDIGFSDSVHRP